MNGLAPGWEWATIEEIAQPGRHALAIGPFGSNLKTSDYRDRGVPLIFVRHIRAKAFDKLDPKFVDLDKAAGLAAHRVAPGDVLVTKMGDPPGDACVYPDREPAIITADCIKISPGYNSDSYYISYAIQSPRMRAVVLGITQGVAQKKVSLGRFRKIAIPLAPLREQSRIVAAIEEIFSHLDAAQQVLLSAEQRLDVLKRVVIMSAAAMFDPPAHWKIVTVADAGTTSLGLQRSPKRHHGPRMRPYLRVANVFEDRIDTDDVMMMDMSDHEWEKYRLRSGDVLLNEGQSPEFLGRPAIYRDDPLGVAFTNSLIRFQAGEEVDPEWALLVFRSHMHSGQFMEKSQITTNIAHLSLGRLKSVKFPIPPRSEQAIRVQVAREQLMGCERLGADIAKATQRLRVLRRAILDAAFAGQLVEQDPSDEPASVLLDRIRAERQAKRGKTKTTS